MYYQVKIFLIDNWTAQDTVVLQINGEDVSTIDTGQLLPYFTSTSSCGGSNSDLPYLSIVGKHMHSNPKLIVRIISNISSNPTVASYGVRGFYAVFANKTTDDTENYCYRGNSIYPSAASSCLCTEGTYPDSTNPTQCLACNPSCSDCFGGSASECFLCADGYSRIKSRCVQCSSTCNTCSGTAKDQCITCKSGYWLRWDNTCVKDCSSPSYAQQVYDDLKLCQAPCPANQLMLWDGSCVDRCLAPLVQLSKSTGYFCNKPCSDALPYYLLTSKTGGKCSKTCEYPYDIQTVRGVATCTLSWMKAKQRVKALTSMIDMEVIIGSIELKILSLTSFAKFICISLMTTAKMMQDIKYLKINYTSELSHMFAVTDSRFLSLNYGLPLTQHSKDKFPPHKLPKVFEAYNLHSSFFLNFWDAFGTILLILAVILVSSFMVPRTEKSSKLYAFFLRAKSIMRWDYLLIILCCNFQDIVLFSSLEFRTIHITSITSAVSFFICMGVNIFALYVLFKIIYIIRSIRGAKNKIFDSSATFKPQADDSERWEAYGILFKGFYTEHFEQHAFMFIYLLRLYASYFIIGYMFDAPFIQATLLTALSVAMILYLILNAPFEQRFNLWYLIMNEILVFIVNLCAMILSIYDGLFQEVLEKRRSICFVIVGVTFLFNLLAILYLNIQMIRIVIWIYRTIQTCKADGITSWSGIIGYLLRPQETSEKVEEEPLAKLQQQIQAIPKNHRYFKNLRIHPDTPTMTERTELNTARSDALSPASEIEFILPGPKRGVSSPSNQKFYTGDHSYSNSNHKIGGSNNQFSAVFTKESISIQNSPRRPDTDRTDRDEKEEEDREDRNAVPDSEMIPKARDFKKNLTTLLRRVVNKRRTYLQSRKKVKADGRSQNDLEEGEA